MQRDVDFMAKVRFFLRSYIGRLGTLHATRFGLMEEFAAGILLVLELM